MPAGRPTPSRNAPRRVKVCPECATPIGMEPAPTRRGPARSVLMWMIAALSVAVVIGYSISTIVTTNNPVDISRPALPRTIGITKAQLLELAQADPQPLWLWSELLSGLSSADPFGIEPNAELLLELGEVTTSNDRFTALGRPAPVFYQWAYPDQMHGHPAPTVRQAISNTQLTFAEFAVFISTGYFVIWLGGLAVALMICILAARLATRMLARPDRPTQPRHACRARPTLHGVATRAIAIALSLLLLAWLTIGSMTVTDRSIRSLMSNHVPGNVVHTGIHADDIRRIAESGNRSEFEAVQTIIANIAAQQHGYYDVVVPVWHNPSLRGTTYTHYATKWPESVWSATVIRLPHSSTASLQLSARGRYIGWKGPLGASRDTWLLLWLDWTAIVQIVFPFWLAILVIQSAGNTIRHRRIRSRLRAGLCAACGYPTPTA